MMSINYAAPIRGSRMGHRLFIDNIENQPELVMSVRLASGIKFPAAQPLTDPFERLTRTLSRESVGHGC